MERYHYLGTVRLAALTLLLALMPLAAPAAATWPDLLHYQGHLTDSSDGDLADGNVSMEFNLYAAPSGGSALWTETQVVAVKKGLFNVILGSVTPLSGLGASVLNNDIWVGVKVAADAEMTPRHQLLPGLYARNAQRLAGLLPDNTANNLVVLDASARIPSGVGVQGASLILPLDLTGSSSTYALNVSNTSASASALGVSVAAPNGLQAQATDASGYAVLAQSAPADSVSGIGLRASAVNGTGIVAQSTNAVAVSASSSSTNRATFLALGAFPMRLTASSAVAANAGLQAFTQDASAFAALVDRGNKAGLFASAAGSGYYGVSATSALGTGVYGQSNSGSANDSGVTGVYAGAAAGGGIAVLGVNAVANGTGAVGRHNGSGAGQGVRGASATGAGAIGVFGTVSGTAAIGVQGFASASDSTGVYGLHASAAPGANAAGVLGKSNSLAVGTGVRGEGSNGVYGLSNGVCGVCAYNQNTGGGFGLYATSPVEALRAEASGAGGVSYGVNASIQSSTANSAAGIFQAQGDSGATYGVFAGNDSDSGYAVYASGGSEAVHARSLAGGRNFFSDVSNSPLYGFYHSAPTSTEAPVGSVGVYAAQGCESCYAGNFINTQTTTGAGAALYVQGRIKVQPNTGAGTFTAGSGNTTFALNNTYIRSGSLIFLTVATATSSVAAVTAVTDGSATITFTPALAANTTYQYLIIGQ